MSLRTDMQTYLSLKLPIFSDLCIVEFCFIIKVPFIPFKGVFFIYDVVRECRLRVRDISRLTRERNILGSPLAPFSRSSSRQSKAEKFISSVRLHSILGSLRKLLVLPWTSAQVTKWFAILYPIDYQHIPTSIPGFWPKSEIPTSLPALSWTPAQVTEQHALLDPIDYQCALTSTPGFWWIFLLYLGLLPKLLSDTLNRIQSNIDVLINSAFRCSSFSAWLPEIFLTLHLKARGNLRTRGGINCEPNILIWGLPKSLFRHSPYVRTRKPRIQNHGRNSLPFSVCSSFQKLHSARSKQETSLYTKKKIFAKITV